MKNIRWRTKVGEAVESLPSGSVGFVYEIAYASGKKYIGKKKAISVINKKAKLNGEPRVGHVRFFNRIVKRKRVKYEEVISESKWREYEGSSELIEPEDNIISKTILMILGSGASMTYYEAKMLFCSGAIESSSYYNESIFGRLYYKATTNVIEGD